MKTIPTHPVRLPTFKEQRSFGGRLVERTVSITLVSILLLAIATVFVLMNFQVESAVEASGVLEPQVTEAGQGSAWNVVLRIPEREINRIQLGAQVRILVPAALEGGSWDGEGLPAQVVAIGTERAVGSTPERALYQVEAALDSNHLSIEQRKRFRSGMTAKAHVITRSALASDLILLHIRRELERDG